MRDAFKVFEIIPTLGGGGAERVVLDLCQGFKEKHDVTLISLYGPEYATDNRLDFVKNNDINVLFLNKKNGFDIKILYKLLKMILKDKPDIVHTHIEAFQYVFLIRLFAKFNHVHTMHSIVGKESSVYQFLLKVASLLRKTNFVVLSNEISRAMQFAFGTYKDRITCIPNGIDRDYYRFLDRSLNKDSYTFITVGSLIPVKNQKMLIEAFFEVEKMRGNVDYLIIVGDGQLRNDLKNLIKKLHLDNLVLMPGNVDNVRDYLYDSDVFVMTSHYEGVSLALLEAASTGLPIIITNTGNTPFVVKDDAILIEDNNVDQLAKEMAEIVTNENKLLRYREKSKLLSMRFDKENMLKAYDELFKQII